MSKLYPLTAVIPINTKHSTRTSNPVIFKKTALFFCTENRQTSVVTCAILSGDDKRKKQTSKTSVGSDVTLPAYIPRDSYRFGVQLLLLVCLIRTTRGDWNNDHVIKGGKISVGVYLFRFRGLLGFWECVHPCENESFVRKLWSRAESIFGGTSNFRLRFRVERG